MKNLRPRQAADALGIGLSTFWERAKSDPDFPPLVRLGRRCTVVREEDLDAYMERQARQARRARHEVQAGVAP